MAKENKTPNLFAVPQTNVVPISHRRDAPEQELTAQLKRAAMKYFADGKETLSADRKQALFDLANKKAMENKGGDER